jgi:hypothetical protein
MPGKEKQFAELADRLKTLPVEGPSLGGPYVGITPNAATQAIVAQGQAIIPTLVQRLGDCTLNEAIYIVFCLHELHARNAKADIRRLQASHRFDHVTRDLTLDMQIQFFLRDVDTW